MPTPLANSWSCGLPSKTVGIPTTTIVPITAPVTDVRPPTTETASTLSDCCGREVVGNAGRVAGREQAPCECRDPARDRERDDLRPGRRHGVGGGVGLVVAHREQRAAQPGLAEVGDEQDHEDRDDEAEVVVPLLVVEEVPRPDRGWLQRRPLAAERVVQEIEVEHPGAHDQREAERDHTEIEAAHTQRGNADHDRDHHAPGHRDPDRHEVAVALASRQVDVDRVTHGARVVRGEVRADGDERELAERQLPGPAGEHRRRHRDDQEHEHERVVDEAARQALELREERSRWPAARRSRRSARRARAGAGAAPRDRRGRAASGSTRSRRWTPPAPARSTSSRRRMNITSVTVPLSSLASTTVSITPTAIPPTIASGNDVIPPTSAAVNVGSSRPGPKLSVMFPRAVPEDRRRQQPADRREHTGDDPHLGRHRPAP